MYSGVLPYLSWAPTFAPLALLYPMPSPTPCSGTAEYVALWLKNIGHERWFYIYISVLAACSLVAYVRMRETKATSRIEED